MRTEVHRAGGGMNPFTSHPEFHDPTTPIPSPSLPRHSIHTVKRKQVRERGGESLSVSDQNIPRQKKTLSLEEYAFFLEDPFNDDVLTTAQLHQIILMRGFRRIHKRSKARNLTSFQLLHFSIYFLNFFYFNNTTTIDTGRQLLTVRRRITLAR